MIGLIKYVKGYLRIRVWGFAPERFINLCSNKNILLWDIRREGDMYYMNISLEGFRNLRPIARKTRTRVVILKRFGLPFFIPKICARKMFVFGLLATVFFWYYTSFFIWEIQITGNQKITNDILMEFLKKGNIHVGIPIRQVDLEELEKSIRKEFQEITWTSAKFSGTNLIISLKENDAILFPQKEEIQSDLYAEYSGKIVSMIVRSGIPLVKPGDEVKEGDLLVSGSVPVYNEDATIRKYQFTRADAEIEMERTKSIQKTLPFQYIKKKYTGRSCKEYEIRFWDKSIFWGKKNSFTDYEDIGTKKEFIIMKEILLPFTVYIHEYREYQKMECLYERQEAEQILWNEYEKDKNELIRQNITILEENLMADSSESGWVLEGELLVRSRVGKEQKIEVEKEQKIEDCESKNNIVY